MLVLIISTTTISTVMIMMDTMMIMMDTVMITIYTEMTMMLTITVNHFIVKTPTQPQLNSTSI